MIYLHHDGNTDSLDLAVLHEIHDCIPLVGLAGSQPVCT
jgi:hypothetical protein